MASKKREECSHTRFERREVSNYEWVDDEYIDIGGYEVVEVSSTVDIDLHRYKCTQCNKIFYYSGAARTYYEDGEDNHIKETAGQKVGNQE